ncbi:MAG: adenosine deaminase [Pseudomonadota bacterium]
MRSRAFSLFPICLLLLMTGIPQSAAANERAAKKRLDAVQDDPVALRQFLYKMPKGGDLHFHIDGSIYAETFIRWAAEDGKCVDLSTLSITLPPCSAEEQRPAVVAIQNDASIVNKLIDGFSVRNYEKRELSGHKQFFSTFGRFITASFGREGDMIAKVTARAAAQNISYLEMMVPYGIFPAIALADETNGFDASLSVAELMQDERIDKLVTETLSNLDAYEARAKAISKCGTYYATPACGVTVRYQAQVLRAQSRAAVIAQTVLAARLIAADERYVGLNFVQPEDDPVSLRDYQWHMELIAAVARAAELDSAAISLHAGELALGLVPPEELGKHIRQAIEVAGAGRIGHGVDITYDPKLPQLMQLMADKGIAVEVNLTSNEVILGVAGDEHPFDTYRKYGVPITLSTDDEGVSRIDLTHEYQRAAETYKLSYDDLKQIARNALTYSALAGESLYSNSDSSRPVKACRKSKPGSDKPGEACAAFLEGSAKARLQWDLELRFSRFEASL